MPGDLSRLYKRLGATKAHIKFLIRCSKSHLVPEGLCSKPIFKTKKSDGLEERFAKIRLRELLNSLHAKAFMLQMSIDSYPNKGEYKFPEQQLKNMQDREYYKIHSKKLEKLRAKKNEGNEGRNLKMDAVLNLSDKPLLEAQRRVLARGFKFRPTIPGIPVLDIVTATESDHQVEDGDGPGSITQEHCGNGAQENGENGKEKTNEKQFVERRMGSNKTDQGEP